MLFCLSTSVSIPLEPVMTLCRCGGSSNKPFCNDKHRSIDFKD
ncbi:MAG: CDGSH iron-sulfur domain-containing protein, partial [Methanomethylovorans sp.]|nr:CDGSH iron-sulfur domain-containing protein [Methanomethylovorans sp.]